MTFLALDTSGDYTVLALADEASGTVRSATAFEGKRTLSRRLLGELDALLRAEGSTLSDLTAIAVGLGPGSFTGLRVGVTTAKTLAQVLAIPLIGIGTLDAYAVTCSGNSRSVVVPVLPSRRGECYAAFYRDDLPGQPEALSLGELSERLTSLQEQVILCGAVSLVTQGANAIKVPMLWTPPEGLAQLASAKIAAEQFDDPLGLVPLYVVPPHITLPRDRSILPA